MYINDLEDEFYLNGIEGIDIGMLQIFLLLYADDIAIISYISRSTAKRSGYSIFLLSKMETYIEY